LAESFELALAMRRNLDRLRIAERPSPPELHGLKDVAPLRELHDHLALEARLPHGDTKPLGANPQARKLLLLRDILPQSVAI
jgi:hypothetical protein